MSRTLRVILVAALGVGVLAVVLAEVWIWHGGRIRIPLKIAIGEGFPLPLFSWIGVILYACCYGGLFGLSRGERWARAIRLGFGLHVIALLDHLAWSLTHGLGTNLSVWYLRSWSLVWGAVLALGLAWVGRTGIRWVLARRADPHLFFLPLLIGEVLFWGHAWVLDPWLTGCATAVGLSLLAAAGLPAIRAAGGRLRVLISDQRCFLALVFLAALGLRLFYTTRVMSNPNFLLTGSDGNAYDGLAWAMVQGTTDPRWSGITMFAPGYVRFLALLYRLFGRNYFAVCAVQSVIGALACLVLYAIAKRLFGVRVARIASAFGVVNFLMVFSAAAIGHQAMDIFWPLLVIWCLLCYLEAPDRRGRWLPAIGLLLGWATLTREGNGAFWLFLIGWLLLGVRARLGWQTALAHAVLLSIGFLIMIVPFSTGGTLHGRFAALWFYGNPLNDWFNPWRNGGAAWGLLRDQPLEVLARVSPVVLANANEVFFSQDMGSFDPVFLVRPSLYYYGMWGYAYVVALTGFVLVSWQAVRRPIERLGWWLVLGFLASRAAVHLFFQAASRYRAPIEPYLIMLAAFGVLHLLAIGRSSNARAP